MHLRLKSPLFKVLKESKELILKST